MSYAPAQCLQLQSRTCGGSSELWNIPRQTDEEEKPALVFEL